MTDAALVLVCLFAPVVFAVWRITRKRRRTIQPALTPADVEVFALELEYCGDDVIGALQREKR